MPDQTAGALSPYLRRKRIEAVLPHLAGRVLDYGCGVGGLAGHVPPDRYVGVDRDEESLTLARQSHPQHRFTTPDGIAVDGERFDTVALLAVIEHAPDPDGLVARLVSSSAPGGRLVLTTPHRRLEWVHDAGARVGLFSRDASEEHERLFDRGSLEALVRDAGLTLLTYRRFLFGANQLVVASRPSS